MKKLLLLFVSFALVLSQASAYAGTVRKVFFDRNLKYTEFEEFASYYRVELHSDDPDQPIVYRFYNMAGKLLAEGTATKLDDKDHTKSIYVGENISYYDNGNIAEHFELSSPGPLADADYYECFDEDGNLIMKGSQKDGVFSGEKFESDDQSHSFHYYVVDDKIQGEFQGYLQDVLFVTTAYDNGIEVGPRVYYYPSGKVKATYGILDGIINGDYISYDENGREEDHITYKKGVPVGLLGLGLNDPTVERRPLTYHEMESDPDSPFSVSALVSYNEYTVDNKRVKTRAGKRISGRADHLNIFRYDLYIRNLTDKPVQVSLDSIKVLTYRKNQSSIEDIYIDEANAHEICLRHLSHVKDIAYERIEDIAKSAATTTSTTYGSQTTYAKSSYNRANATVSAGVGANASRAGAVGSSGYVFGGSRGGWAALGGSVSGTSATAYGRSTTISSSNTKTVDNGVYYQVFENETRKANDYVNQEKEDTLDEIERLITSSFTIPAKGFIEREILASEDLKGFVKLVFYIQGYAFSLEIED